MFIWSMFFPLWLLCCVDKIVAAGIHCYIWLDLVFFVSCSLFLFRCAASTRFICNVLVCVCVGYSVCVRMCAPTPLPSSQTTHQFDVFKFSRWAFSYATMLTMCTHTSRKALEQIPINRPAPGKGTFVRVSHKQSHVCLVARKSYAKNFVDSNATIHKYCSIIRGYAATQFTWSGPRRNRREHSSIYTTHRPEHIIQMIFGINWQLVNWLEKPLQ